jgi:predicted dehydrogenase
VLLRFEGGARGVLIASQISAGARNGLTLSVYGEKGGLTWSHEDPNVLTLDWLDGPSQVLHAGSGYLGAAARAVTRLPTGHPEGFIEAFANIYRDFADAIAGRGRRARARHRRRRARHGLRRARRGRQPRRRRLGVA